MVSNPVMSDMVENPTATPTQIAAVETKTSAISDTGVISVNTKNIVSNNTLTQSFDSDQVVAFNLTDSIDAVSPIVSVFKEVPQQGFSSKGQWDVNSNATNYDFYDEKPISYASSTLTPSATGNGTFTNSTAIVTGYNFTNFAYDSVTAATGISGNNEAIRFNNNGTKMYILSDGGPDGIYQFSLSTAYDITTASYDSVSFSVTQDSSPRDFQFNSDGSKMFILGSTNRQIYRYSLSTAYDLSTTSYDSVSLSIAYSTSMLHFHFNGDGTKIYVGSSATWTIYERQLPGAYDISSESAVSTFGYNADLPSGSTEAYAYSGIFNDNGKKMYLLIGRMPDMSEAVIEYDLSTAYDLSTISRTSIQTLNPSNAGNDPRGMTWNSDGTKLIILTEPDDMFRFTSSTPSAFNAADVGKKVVGNSGSAIITATSGTYTSVTPFADTSAISSWQLFGAQGKSDGSGITLAGFSSDFDISSAGSELYNSLDTYITGWAIRFSNDGTRLFLLGIDGSNNGQVFRFDLNTAYDLNSINTNGGSNNSGSFSFWAVDVTFNSDGSLMYVLSGGNVYKYTATNNAFTGSGLSVTLSNTANISSIGVDNYSLEFSSDGTKLYIGQFLSNFGGVRQLNLTTAWDPAAGFTDAYSYTITEDTIALNKALPYAIRFVDNGSKMLVLGGRNDEIYQYTLSTAWDLSTASYSNKKYSNSSISDFRGFDLSADTSMMFTFERNNNQNYYRSFNISDTTNIVLPYSTYSPALTNSSTGQINSSSWSDINSMTADETKNDGDVFYAVSTDNRTSWGVAKASDGVRKIVKNNSGTWQYNNDAGTSTTVNLGFSLASPSYDNKSYSVSHSSPRGMYLKPDGTELYIGAYTGHVYQYTLSTPNDISTASSTGNYNIDEENDTVALTFKPDGTKMYAASGTNVHQYTLSTAWDITTASYDSVSYTPSDIGSSNIHSLNFNSDGTKLFISDDGAFAGGRRIHEYTLSTAYLLSSASTTSNYLYHAKANVRGVDFNSDGTKIFLSSYSTQSVYQYNLASPYTLSSSQGTTADAEYDASSVISSGMYSMAFSNDGAKLFILESNTDTVKQFSTTESQNTIAYGISETWVNGTNNNEHATLQQALTSQAFNRMDKSQLDAVADAYHFSQDSADTLDLMIAPYAASGSSPISDGVTINYDAEALVREAVPGTDYIAEFPNSSTINIKSLVNTNMKVRAL
jgi:hypothetical protein